MEILLFVITRPTLATWWARALIVAVAASAVLNLSPRLPWFMDIKASRINARWVGYAGLTAALAVWTAFWGDWTGFCAWVIIAVTTLVPNTLTHWRAESAGGNRNNGPLPPFIILPMEGCEDILAGLVDPRRDLTVAAEAITQAILKARRVVELTSNQTQAQIWAQSLKDPLDMAVARVEETRDKLESIHKAVAAFWQVIDAIRLQWRQGLIVVNKA